jgi:hypothetical protein
MEPTRTPGAPGKNEDGVVARDRPHDVGQVEGVEIVGQTLAPAGEGADDN